MTHDSLFSLLNPMSPADARAWLEHQANPILIIAAQVQQACDLVASGWGAEDAWDETLARIPEDTQARFDRNRGVIVISAPEPITFSLRGRDGGIDAEVDADGIVACLGTVGGGSGHRYVCL